MAESGSCFAQTYAAAREKFLAATDAAHLDVHSHVHPERGRDSEVLALDVVRDGPADAEHVLLVSSGCHGVEGFCGSGIQVAMLRDAAWRKAAAQAGVAVVYLHALNPYGFSWWRRTTHENVDLNRNFQRFADPLPRNTAYDEIAHIIVPPAWPPRLRDQAALLAFLLRRGVRSLQTAVSAGQHAHPSGLFYGGTEPTWSHLAVRAALRDHGRRARRLAWIDLHTGLGPSGVGERIYAGPRDEAALARTKAWWGPKITSVYDGSSSSAPITGMMWNAAPEECPQAEYTGIALEYGTQPLLQTLRALRAEQWLHNHPDQDERRRAAIKQQLRDAFYTDTDAWKQQVTEQAMHAAHQAVAGLSDQATSVRN